MYLSRRGSGGRFEEKKRFLFLFPFQRRGEERQKEGRGGMGRRCSLWVVLGSEWLRGRGGQSFAIATGEPREVEGSGWKGIKSAM